MNSLIEKARNRDNEAITELFLSMQKELYAISKTRLNNEDDINDAIQETMLSVYKNIHKLREPSFFKTWVIRILINNCNSIYRKNFIYNGFKELVSIPEFNDSNESEQISDIDEKLDFFILIKNLNYEERKLITLFYYNKYTTKQISRILSINENTIRTKIQRAKQKLKKMYKEGMING